MQTLRNRGWKRLRDNSPIWWKLDTGRLLASYGNSEHVQYGPLVIACETYRGTLKSWAYSVSGKVIRYGIPTFSKLVYLVEEYLLAAAVEAEMAGVGWPK